MAHNMFTLMEQNFDQRILFGDCLININGETLDCEVIKDPRSKIGKPEYIVNHKYCSNPFDKEICHFPAWKIEGGPIMYTIEEISKNGGDAVLIVPTEYFMSDIEENYEDEESS